MKKIVILLLIASALLSFSCNQYCNCKHYVDGKLDKDFKGEFIKEIGDCKSYSIELQEIDGVTYETKCK